MPVPHLSTLRPKNSPRRIAGRPICGRTAPWYPRRSMIAPRLCIALLLGPALLPAQDFKAFEKKVTEFTLPNGLHFIVAERHETPVVSFHTYVNAGSVDDPSGKTGIAHMFEHMAFKGTETIGTQDWPAEKKALDVVEEVYDRLDAERNKGPKADPNQVRLLELQLNSAIQAANSYVIPNEFFRIIEQNGGAGLNADTSLDYTEYFYSLPSNRLELWFLLESQRFLHPVFREFYKERSVVMEEERMRIESNPQGKLIQQFLATAFEAHPYRVPGTGWPSDIMNLRSRDAKAFFDHCEIHSTAHSGGYLTAQSKREAGQDSAYEGSVPAAKLASDTESTWLANG